MQHLYVRLCKQFNIYSNQLENYGVSVKLENVKVKMI